MSTSSVRRQQAAKARRDLMIQANRDARKRWPVQEKINGAHVQKLYLP